MRSFLILLLAGFILSACSSPRHRVHPQKVPDSREENFFRNYLSQKRGQKICLISNQWGLGRHSLYKTGSSTKLSVAIESTGNTLVRILTPEHGILGVEEAEGSKVAAGVETRSIYFPKGQKPVGLFDGCSLVVFDLPDTGVRPWTYRSVLESTMYALSGSNAVLAVLDSPNPYRQFPSAGPVSEKKYRSVLGRSEISFLYPYTFGEHALAYRKFEKLNLHLDIIKMEHYGDPSWKQSNPYRPPSPNLPHERAVSCYWFAIALEGTLIEEGRSTKDPFCTIGHLRFGSEALSFGGVDFLPYKFIPGGGRYGGKILPGYRLVPGGDYRPYEAAYEFLLYHIGKNPDTEWFKQYVQGTYSLDELTGGQSMRKALMKRTPYPQFAAASRAQRLAQDNAMRPFLLYRAPPKMID